MYAIISDQIDVLFEFDIYAFELDARFCFVGASEMRNTQIEHIKNEEEENEKNENEYPHTWSNQIE